MSDETTHPDEPYRQFCIALGKWMATRAWDCAAHVENQTNFDSSEIGGVEYAEMEVDSDDGCIRVFGSAVAMTSRKVSSGTRRHPPEYEQRDVPVGVVIEWRPDDTEQTPMFTVTIEQGGPDPFAAPDPEPQWRDI